MGLPPGAHLRSLVSARLLLVLLFAGSSGCALISDKELEERRDQDGDGHNSTQLDGDDCDDTDAQIHPGSPEDCDRIDQDCDGDVDEGAGTTWYLDLDLDAYGALDSPVVACEAPASYVSLAGDCDDGNPDVNPWATEICNSIDDDCDADIDETGDTLWYVDHDGDGYGDDTTTTTACVAPEGYASEGGDCDDGEPSITIGDRWYTDEDGDGYGMGEGEVACGAPAGTVADQTDCDDGAPEVNPGEVEICENDVDDDCDGGPGDCRIVGPEDPADHGLLISTGESEAKLGSSVALGGDLDGDGLMDILIGAEGSSGAGRAKVPGAVWILDDLPTTGEQSTDGLPAAVTGAARGDLFGHSLVGLGMFNDGGAADFAVGAPGRKVGDVDDAGAVYIFYTPLSKEIDLDLEAEAGLWSVLRVDQAGAMGWAIAGPGDVNDDGWDELLAGAPRATVGGETEAGVVHLVFGEKEPETELSAGITIEGANTDDQLGAAVSGAGDVDGDGLADLLIGASGVDEGGDEAGAAYLLYGATLALSSRGPLPVAGADLRFVGNSEGDALGFAVAGAGDMDLDGHSDLLIGAPGEESDGSPTGALWLLLGGALGSGDVQDLAAADVHGSDSDTGFATVISPAGDVDADGALDVLVSAPDQSGGNGVVWLLYGPLSGSLHLGSADPRYAGNVANEALGSSLAAVNDLDLDGYDDILLGAPDASGDGVAWLLFGSGL